MLDYAHDLEGGKYIEMEQVEVDCKDHCRLLTVHDGLVFLYWMGGYKQ